MDTASGDLWKRFNFKGISVIDDPVLLFKPIDLSQIIHRRQFLFYVGGSPRYGSIRG